MKHAVKIMSVLAMMAAAGLPAVAASAGANGQGGDAHKKTILVTLSGPLAPYNFQKEDQSWAGLSADALAYAAHKAGYEVQYKPMAFENEIPALINERVDVASGIYVTAERSKKLDFIPLVRSSFGVIMKKEDAAKIKDWSGLCGKKIGMHFSAPTERAVKDMNEHYCPKDNGAVPTASSGSIPDILNNMQNGRVYAALDDVNMWRAAIRRLPNLEVAIDNIGDAIYWPIAFKKGSELRAELMPHVLEFLKSDEATKTSLEYGMGKNVFVADPDKAVDEVINRR